MAHCQKIKLCDTKRVFSEICRDAEFYQNEVDPSRSRYNYVIDCTLPDSSPSVHYTHYRKNEMSDRVDKRVAQLQYRPRKDTVGLCNWVVTCPEEFKDDPLKQQQFFETVYRFTAERYGKDNVLPGFVHVDETSPHIHIPVIPVVEKNHLCANKFLTRRELQTYQSDLEDVCECEFGIKGLVLNGRTKGNYTLSELKERTRVESELSKREQRIAEREKNLEALENALITTLDVLKMCKEEYDNVIGSIKKEKAIEYNTRMARYDNTIARYSSMSQQQLEDYHNTKA